jgi:hypothetical protein
MDTKDFKYYQGEDALFASSVKIIGLSRWPDPDQLSKELDIGYARSLRLVELVDEYLRDRKYFTDDQIVFGTAYKQIGDRFYDENKNSLLVLRGCALYEQLQAQVVSVDGEILGE